MPHRVGQNQRGYLSPLAVKRSLGFRLSSISASSSRRAQSNGGSGRHPTVEFTEPHRNPTASVRHILTFAFIISGISLYYMKKPEKTECKRQYSNTVCVLKGLGSGLGKNFGRFSKKRAWSPSSGEDGALHYVSFPHAFSSQFYLCSQKITKSPSICSACSTIIRRCVHSHCDTSEFTLSPHCLPTYTGSIHQQSTTPKPLTPTTTNTTQFAWLFIRS